jgi:hypothetical protein
VIQLAADHGFKSLQAQLELESRSMGPVRFWYLKVKTSSGSNTFNLERRIETAIRAEDLEWFAEKGVTVPVKAEDE